MKLVSHIPLTAAEQWEVYHIITFFVERCSNLSVATLCAKEQVDRILGRPVSIKIGAK